MLKSVFFSQFSNIEYKKRLMGIRVRLIKRRSINKSTLITIFYQIFQ